MAIDKNKYIDEKLSMMLEPLDSKQRDWFWLVVETMRKRFPQADHYTLNAKTAKSVELRIGERSLNNLAGKVAYFFYWRGGCVCFAVRDISGSNRRLQRKKIPVEVNFETFGGLREFNRWLDDVITCLGWQNFRINGDGLNPCDYRLASTGEENALLPLNQILCGPPGTGKTYNTINKALEILKCETIFHADIDSSEWRQLLKSKFDEYVAAGRIRFVTFHQSFSYEDFVEGLRAVSTENGQLEYSVVAGVFKQLCLDADCHTNAAGEAFADALRNLQEQLLITEEPVKAKTIKGKRFSFDYVGGQTFKIYPEQTVDQKFPYRASLNDVMNLYRTGDKSNMYNVSYVQGILQYLKDNCGLPEFVDYQLDNGEVQPYVLIIDEINRGNISRIFGELITLIEPSKRLGNAEALKVTLPYSKHEFGVPNNVYLIGTMNTADRSLTGIDIALRRRFEFVEMPPKPELLRDVVVEGVNIGVLLTVMNLRIDALIGADFRLGHAYFMPLKDNPSLDLLGSIFEKQILPLLQEYFFDDWQRIAWVLNDHAKTSANAFIVAQTRGVYELFGNVEGLAELPARWSINRAAFNNPISFLTIIDAKAESTASANAAPENSAGVV